jgi:tetratricopeptide (TPR) repeat protein
MVDSTVFSCPMHGEFMQTCLRFALEAFLSILLATTFCPLYALQSAQKVAEKAQREYVSGRFAEAERDFRALVNSDPSNIYLHVYLGQALFRQGKYTESVGPYEKARDLERAGQTLSSDQHRIVVDQLSMAYAISGDLKKARALLELAIKDDPEYPIYYYNLACVFAADGEKGKMLSNLSLAFQRKENVLKGERMPNPRIDSSFQKFADDDDFVTLMKTLGY